MSKLLLQKKQHILNLINQLILLHIKTPAQHNVSRTKVATSTTYLLANGIKGKVKATIAAAALNKN